MGTKLPRVKMREDGSYKLKIISEMQGFSVFVVAKWLREQELKGLYSSGRAADGREGRGEHTSGLKTVPFTAPVNNK